MSTEADRLPTGETARHVRIPTGSVELDGDLLVPESAHGLVLLAHGAGGPVLPRDVLARQLRRGGLGTMVFDLLTPEEIMEESRGAHLRFNMGLLTQRLNCAAHWVADEDEARHLRLGFLAAGTFGGAALVAAADLGQSIGAVVSLAGRPDLAGNALRRVKAPTLLIVGEQDEALLEFNDEAYELLRVEKSLEVVRGAGPEFEETGVIEEAARLATDWFLEHLRPFSGSRLIR